MGNTCPLLFGARTRASCVCICSLAWSVCVCVVDNMHGIFAFWETNNNKNREERSQWRAHLASFLCGGSFAGGLVLSGMVKRAKVVDFLALGYGQDTPEGGVASVDDSGSI